MKKSAFTRRTRLIGPTVALIFGCLSGSPAPPAKADVYQDRAKKYGVKTSLSLGAGIITVTVNNPLPDKKISGDFRLHWADWHSNTSLTTYKTKRDVSVEVLPLSSTKVQIPRPPNVPPGVHGSVKWTRLSVRSHAPPPGAAKPMLKPPQPPLVPPKPSAPVTKPDPLTVPKTSTLKPAEKKGLVRTLTDKQGRTVEAEILRLYGTELHVAVSGKDFRLPMSNLTVKDQNTIREYAASGYKIEGPPGSDEDARDLIDWNSVEPGLIFPGKYSPLIRQREFAIDAAVSGSAPEGIIVTQGGAVSGYCLFIKENRVVFSVRQGRDDIYRVATPVPGGSFSLQARLQKDGTVMLRVGRQTESTETPGLLNSQPMYGVSVGLNFADPVDETAPDGIFSGKIEKLHLHTSDP